MKLYLRGFNLYINSWPKIDPRVTPVLCLNKSDILFTLVVVVFEVIYLSHKYGILFVLMI